MTRLGSYINRLREDRRELWIRYRELRDAVIRGDDIDVQELCERRQAENDRFAEWPDT